MNPWLTQKLYRGSSASRLKVRVGSSFKTGGELVSVEEVISHPDYDRRTIDYDFALLKLQDPLTFNANISSVKLPKQDAKVAEGTIVSVSGWGNTRNSSQSTAQLRVVEVPVVALTRCQELYKGYTVTERMICAGLDAGGKDSCQVRTE